MADGAHRCAVPGARLAPRRLDGAARKHAEIDPAPEIGRRAEFGLAADSLLPQSEIADIAASFQRVVVETLLDRLFDAAQWYGARSVGIAGGVSANSRLREDAATRAATGATAAFRASKALIARLRDERLGLWASMSEENAAQAALCDTADYREGFAAFQEKRRPSFTGA